MSEKIALKEKLAAVDLNAKDLYSSLDETQQKALKSELFILNRYISSAKGSTDVQSHFVLTVNEFYNKNFFTLSAHPELLWKLLCMCNYDGKKVFFHEWIGFKKKGQVDKKVKYLLDIYPTMKEDDVEVMSELMSTDDFSEILRDHGYDEKTIKQILK